MNTMTSVVEANENMQDEKPKKVKMLCRGLRRDLKKCLLETDCVKIDRRLPRDCLNNNPRTSHECHVLAQEFFECKRQWIDMRKRFRGNRGY